MGSGDGADEFGHGLARYLAAEAFPAWSGVDIVDMRRATGGLSWETFVVVVEDPARPDSRRRLVVKRPPLEGPLAPYDLTKQGVLVQALWAGRVPVAEVLGFTPEPVVAGRQVEVQSFVDGEIPDLRTIEDWPAWQDPRRRDRVGGRVMELLAAVQSFDWRTPAVLDVLGGGRTVEDRVGAVVDRLMAKVDASVAPKWGASPLIRDGWLWLRDNVPARWSRMTWCWCTVTSGWGTWCGVTTRSPPSSTGSGPRSAIPCTTSGSSACRWPGGVTRR